MYRVVMVDDEPFMLEGMRMMIDWHRCGFTLCGEASTAQEALRLVDTHQPHLLITDVRLPGMLGTDLATIVNHYHPGVILLFFSGYKDFSYAQSAIRSHAFGYLVKPIDTDEVESTLQSVKAELDARAAREASAGTKTSILRDQVLRRIALGDDSDESILRAGTLMELQRSDPCYCAVIAGERGAVPESAWRVFTAYGAVPFHLSHKQCGLAFRQLERDLPMLTQLLNGMAGHAQLSLSVGGVHRGPRGFARSLREALDAQGVLFERRENLRLYQPFNTEAAAWLARAKPAMLKEMITDTNPETLQGALDSLREAAGEIKPGMFSLRYMAATLDAMLPVAAADKGNTLLYDLWHKETLEPDAWLDVFCALVRDMRPAVKPEPGENRPAPVQAVITAIRKRYKQPLSINAIAENLHINPAYLGQLVRKHTGITFHQHLLETRMEHACLLLRQSDRPISEIAVDVGFRDVDYFSRQFRHRMAMSPMAYRSAGETREDEQHATRE